MVKGPNHLLLRLHWAYSTNNTDHRENGHPSRYQSRYPKKTGFFLASVPLSSAYGPVSLLLVQLFLLFSFPLPLPVSLTRFRDLKSCLNSYLSAGLYEALVWLASTFVQGSKPGEDQGPRRSGKQRAALISTVLSSYYRVWNRFFFEWQWSNERER